MRVGSALDQKPLYGTAHFLEHMLFMGTDKYPKESEYQDYINSNAGSSNAFTSPTDTNYHFNCSIEGFEGALDRFSQFFITPTLNESSTDREKQAVDSECSQAFQSDAWRLYQIQMGLANEGSPFHSFPMGNLQTLSQEGVREALLAFHRKWYSANIMKLCVMSRHELEKLEVVVKELFTPV